MEYTLEDVIVDILRQGQTGVVSINASEGKWDYYMKFLTKIQSSKLNKNRGIVFNIPNWQDFVYQVKKYLDASEEFYAQDQEYLGLDDYEFTQKRILDLFVNVSPADCDNLNKYVKTRTKMFQSHVDCTIKNIGELDNYDICASISKNQQSRASFEAPYTFTPFFVNENFEPFILPSVVFGVVDDKIHLMAIQNLQRKKQDYPFAKKMDRMLRKVNSGFDEKTLAEEDKFLANVSPNALVTLSIFAQYMQDQGLTKVVAPSYLPIRYSNKTENIEQNKRFSVIDEELAKVDQIQYNMTNKLINTLYRFAEHFPYSSCQYDDTTMNTYLKIDTTKPSNMENLIYEITGAVGKDMQMQN